MEKILLSWSTGKDSAWALHLLRGRNLAGLITSFNSEADRVAMHGVRRELALAQAQTCGLPLRPVELPAPCSNAEYEARMEKVWSRAIHEQVTHIAFGDLYLREIRAYREKQLAPTGLTPMFPLWEMDTALLARQMIEGGLKAKVSCVDSKQLSPEFSGREFDQGFINDLPAGVDPCGENGEFHTFVYAAPGWPEAITIRQGETVVREGFVFTDFVSQ